MRLCCIWLCVYVHLCFMILCFVRNDEIKLFNQSIVILRLILYFHGNYNQTSNISRKSVDNTVVDDSDVVGASYVGAAPTTY